MNIVETKSQLDNFLNVYNKYDSIILPIWLDSELHPLNNKLSLLYVRIILEKEYAFGEWRIQGDDYVICLNHSESEELDFDLNLLVNDNKQYTLDKKWFNHIIQTDMIDINMLTYLKTNENLEIKDTDTNSHHYFKRIYWNRRDINSLIPITKHYEKVVKIFNVMEEIIINCEQNELYDIYSKQVIDNLSYIESSGLKVNKDLISLDIRKHLTNDNMIYTEYNPYTTTGRPSNRFGGINFSALNKDDGSREPFISRFDNGMLIELDYDSYHLRLIADIVGYKFPNGSVHEYLGKQYDMEYKESKAMSFKLLYGGIPKEISDNIPFFGKVAEYIKEKWGEFKGNLSVFSDIYNKKIDSANLEDMNANKLFNYLIQLAETEVNMGVVSDIKKVLEGKKSKLVLYQYDSFLFDFDPKDGKNLIIELKNIIEQGGKFPTKVQVGNNYNNMTEVTEKFSGQ